MARAAVPTLATTRAAPVMTTAAAITIPINAAAAAIAPAIHQVVQATISAHVTRATHPAAAAPALTFATRLVPAITTQMRATVVAVGAIVMT
jgi:hypothetical protein